MNPKTEPRLVCVSGADASGKSTQVDAVVRRLSGEGVRARAVGIWDALDDTDVVAALPFGSRSDVYAYLRVLSPRSRVHFLFHALHLALDLARATSPEVIVLNAYWYKYFATEVAHGGDMQSMRLLAAGFPLPQLTFFLDISAETALSRKVSRSDYESGYGDESAFLTFQRTSHAILGSLADELDWVVLDGTRAPEELGRSILAGIRAGVL
ncbi:thymidylate kinase [Rhodococcus sp. 27YEA15]|uniref:dTMP kinase n=1 Tax=Rhodococcus sp. 27YEA15 TaxID=3156259 RepID=UPI003C7A9BE8